MIQELYSHFFIHVNNVQTENQDIAWCTFAYIIKLLASSNQEYLQEYPPSTRDSKRERFPRGTVRPS